MQLYIALRDMILSGTLVAGDRLPASRTLGNEINVSRTTVIDAIDRLTAEGLLESRVGDGTYVSRALEHQRPTQYLRESGKAETATPRLSHTAQHARRNYLSRAWLPHNSTAFVTALPALDMFPAARWTRLSSRHWRSRRDDIMGYGHPMGYWSLRQAVATHLNASRGIKCDPEQIIITNGAQEAFAMVSRILLNTGDRVWYENPGAAGAYNAFVASGANMVPVSIDEQGLIVADGLRKAPHFRLAFVTPSHQQPLGHVMSLPRRLALLQAAEDADAMIVEDDYDGEFHFSNQPQPTLKSIDTQDRVIYVGTFSKSLFPSIRLGFILCPYNLLDAISQVCSSWFSGVPTATQSIVADFMDEGFFAAHIRSTRRAYKNRYQALLDAGEQLPNSLQIQPTASGFHTVAYLDKRLHEQDVVNAAVAKGIIVAPLSRYCQAPIEQHGLVLGFGSTPPESIRHGIKVLKDLPELYN